MLKRIALFLFFAFLSFQAADAWEIIDQNNEAIILDICQEGELDACKAIFIEAFSKAYAEFTPEQLGVENKIAFLSEAFADVYDDFRLGLQDLVVAKKEGQIVGFVGFKKTEVPNQIYISQLAVDPNYWQRGIGKHLVFSVFHLSNHVNHLFVIPRRINTVARNFYQKLGFTESSYMHPGYSPQKYMGYEWIIPNEKSKMPF